MYSNHSGTEGEGRQFGLKLSALKSQGSSDWNASEDEDDGHRMILNLEINNPTNYNERSPFMEKLQSRMELYFDRTN